MIRELFLPDEQATRALGIALGRAAADRDVIALEGPLGAGKTCLARGVAEGLEVADLRLVVSPTFSIWNIHPGRLVMHHMDLYRLGDPDEAIALGLEEVIGVEGVCLIEWPTRLPRMLPADHLEVALEPEGSGRRARLTSGGPRSEQYLRAVTP